MKKRHNFAMQGWWTRKEYEPSNFLWSIQLFNQGPSSYNSWAKKKSVTYEHINRMDRSSLSQYVPWTSSKFRAQKHIWENHPKIIIKYSPYLFRWNSFKRLSPCTINVLCRNLQCKIQLSANIKGVKSNTYLCWRFV